MTEDNELDDLALLLQYSFQSSREKQGAGPTTLQIQAWNNGEVTFIWSEKNISLATAEFCTNAFFNIMLSIPTWFAEVGKLFQYESCSIPTIMGCLHDVNPELLLGVSKQGEENMISMVSIDRGTLLAALDQIGYCIAALEHVDSCDNEISEEEVPLLNDPFADLDMTICH